MPGRVPDARKNHSSQVGTSVRTTAALRSPLRSAAAASAGATGVVVCFLYASRFGWNHAVRGEDACGGYLVGILVPIAQFRDVGLFLGGLHVPTLNLARCAAHGVWTSSSASASALPTSSVG